MFIDSDDWIEINALEKMLEIIEKYNADVARCNYFVNYENKEIIGNVLFNRVHPSLRNVNDIVTDFSDMSNLKF